MNPLILIAGLFVLYEVLTRSGIALPGITTNTSTGLTAPVVENNQLMAAPSYSLVGSTTTGVGIAGSSAVAGVGVALNFVPVVGPALSAAFSLIAGGLMKASAQRAAEARSENAAVAREVPAWDAGVQQIIGAYNSGKITASDALAGLASPQTQKNGLTQSANGILWQAYWNVLTPQVQPGRNGCKSGQVPHTVSFCTGDKSYGAGCCVAYDDLDNGSLYVAQAVLKAEANPGQSIQSQMVPTVYGSKYGGINRPGYSVVVKKPIASSGLIAL